MKKRFTEAQIVGFLREADAGIPVKDLCRKHGFAQDIGKREAQRRALASRALVHVSRTGTRRQPPTG
jgi:hypothetical protein